MTKSQNNLPLYVGSFTLGLLIIFGASHSYSRGVDITRNEEALFRSIIVGLSFLCFLPIVVFCHGCLKRWRFHQVIPVLSLLCFSILFTYLNEHSSNTQYMIFAIAGIASLAVSGLIMVMGIVLSHLSRKL